MIKRIAIIGLFLLLACSEKLPVLDDFGTSQYKLINQNNEQILFSRLNKGKIVVMNYIFTNCPDICPLSTNNMRLIQEKVKKEKIENIQFVSLSFDPENDTPEVLLKFAGIRNLNLSNWEFLTGKKATVDSIINRVGVMAIKNDSTVFKDGRKIFYYVHTDRIQLIDAEGKIRKNYKGSTININEIINDIKSLQ